MYKISTVLLTTRDGSILIWFLWIFPPSLPSCRSTSRLTNSLSVNCPKHHYLALSHNDFKELSRGLLSWILVGRECFLETGTLSNSLPCLTRTSSWLESKASFAPSSLCHLMQVQLKTEVMPCSGCTELNRTFLLLKKSVLKSRKYVIEGANETFVINATTHLFFFFTNAYKKYYLLKPAENFQVLQIICLNIGRALTWHHDGIHLNTQRAVVCVPWRSSSRNEGATLNIVNGTLVHSNTF